MGCVTIGADDELLLFEGRDAAGDVVGLEFADVDVLLEVADVDGLERKGGHDCDVVVVLRELDEAGLKLVVEAVGVDEVVGLLFELVLLG